MKISEIFTSIQGEGRYVGYPALFIRLAGCNLRCKWCDEIKRWRDYREMDIREIERIIINSDKDYVIWTGGEPTLQMREVEDLVVMTRCWMKQHMLETNGTLNDKKYISFYEQFDYISMSPKRRLDAKRWIKNIGSNININFDIKVVTDLEEIGMDLLDYATMLMPLTTGDKEKDRKIKQRVWKYCVENNLLYSPRLQVEVWDNAEGR